MLRPRPPGVCRAVTWVRLPSAAKVASTCTSPQRLEYTAPSTTVGPVAVEVAVVVGGVDAGVVAPGPPSEATLPVVVLVGPPATIVAPPEAWVVPVPSLTKSEVRPAAET